MARINGHKAKSRNPSRVEVLGIATDCYSMDQTIARIEALIKKRGGKTHTLSFVNPEIIMTALKHSDYYDFLRSAELVVPDGAGVLWASRVLGSPLPERVTGTDMMYRLAKLSADKGYGIYFLGGRSGVAERAAQRLERLYPGARFAGTRNGYFSPEQEDDIVSDINASGADVLVVCLGMYRQEMWIKRNMDRLRVPVAFGNGGALDFAAGGAKRAPAWMCDHGLEWLWRLLREPKRIKRQAVLPLFVLRVLARKMAILSGRA